MYKFYIDEVRLPVTPGEISFSNGANIDVVDLANGEKITRWIGRELETITFKASFPYNRYGSFVDFSLREPSYYINKFMYLMENGITFEFVMFDLDWTRYDLSNSLSNPALVKTMYIQSLQRTDSAENGSEPELEFTLLEWAEKTTHVYSSKAKQIDVVVDNPSESILAETGSVKTVEKMVRPNPRKRYIPLYHTVLGVKPSYRFTPRTPTYKELMKLSYEERLYGGFTLALIRDRYFQWFEGENNLRELNPELSEKGWTEILEMGTLVQLRDLEPYDKFEDGKYIFDTPVPSAQDIMQSRRYSRKLFPASSYIEIR